VKKEERKVEWVNDNMKIFGLSQPQK